MIERVETSVLTYQVAQAYRAVVARQRQKAKRYCSYELEGSVYVKLVVV